MRMSIAHIRDRNGQEFIQSLKEHSENTAFYAKSVLENAGFANCSYLLGLLHDMGKAKQEFETYIKKSHRGEKVQRGSVNHTFAGVIYLLEKYHSLENQSHFLTSEILSYAIGAHHGLFDCCSLDGRNGFSYRLEKDKNVIHYSESKENYFREVVDELCITELFEKASDEIWIFYNQLQKKYKGKNEGNERIFFEMSMLCRLLLSAVIYGDRRDTIEFMSDRKKEMLKFSWKEELEFFEAKLAKMTFDTPVNKVRADISKQCASFAQRGGGIYTLNVPTGGGKTLCTLRYALTHAEKHKKKRIIFVIPLLSILDQNSQVIKSYIKNNDIVMEHHSNIVRERQDGNELDEYELFTVTWDSPVIVTTMVQFLNILFSHETSAIGRMQALCDSIIVIDEIQSLPKKTIMMFNMAINFLKDFCHATVVLSSATQPSLGAVKWPVEYDESVDMVTLTNEQLEVFNRTEIVDKTSPAGMTLDECSEFCMELLDEASSELIICNTKRQALEIYRQIEGMNQVRVYHLSTSMCKAHRAGVLKNLTSDLQKLRENVSALSYKKVICVSTQLVEAGVDFSFECVVRLMAGIDNLAQAAGRCNRNGEFNRKCKVYLVNINNKDEDLRYLSDIKKAKDSTEVTLHSGNELVLKNLIGKEAVELFYRSIFENAKEKDELSYVVELKDIRCRKRLAYLLANKEYCPDKSKPFFLGQPFLTVGREFKVFDDETTDIIVPYQEGKRYIDELIEIANQPCRTYEVAGVMEKLKEYVVSIYDWQKRKLDENGMILPYADGKILILKEEAYSEQTGIVISDELSVDNYIL